MKRENYNHTEFYYGHEHYYLRFENGQHVVHKSFECGDYYENEVVFAGHYEECLDFMYELECQCIETEMDI